MQAQGRTTALSGGSCIRIVIAASTARDRLFRHANTAQTDSAMVPDFQREIRSVLRYRKIVSNRYEQQGERGRETEMIAKQPAAKAKPEQQRHQPYRKLCGRLLQIGSHREIRKQQAGKHNRKLQNRAQNILQSTRPLCSRNSINACRALFRSS